MVANVIPEDSTLGLIMLFVSVALFLLLLLLVR